MEGSAELKPETGRDWGKWISLAEREEGTPSHVTWPSGSAVEPLAGRGIGRGSDLEEFKEN